MNYEAEEDENFYGDVEDNAEFYFNGDNEESWEEQWCSELNVFKTDLIEAEQEKKKFENMRENNFSKNQIDIVRQWSRNAKVKKNRHNQFYDSVNLTDRMFRNMYTGYKNGIDIETLDSETNVQIVKNRGQTIEVMPINKYWENNYN